jgi:hypothetical protein
MAPANLTRRSDWETLEPQERPGYGKLSLLNGLFIGASLALGSWGLEAWRLAGLPVENAYISLILGSLSLIILCTVIGSLSGRMAKPWMPVILWLLTAMLCALIIGYQPYIGRTVAEWLADTRAWGLPIYISESITNTGLILGSLPLIVILAVLALLQSGRLERAVVELGDRGRMTSRALLILLAPMPFVVLAAYITSSIQIKPAAGALDQVDKAIKVAYSKEADLTQLGIQKGINYGALSAVQDQLTDNYVLRIGENDPAAGQTFILAEFDNGAWINCRTIYDQLTFCYDAGPPYIVGLASLIKGEPPPEDCRGCQIRLDEELAAWLQARGPRLGSNPKIERLGQWGGFVLVKASAADDSYHIECLFDKMSPLQLASCEEE